MSKLLCTVQMTGIDHLMELKKINKKSGVIVWEYKWCREKGMNNKCEKKRRKDEKQSKQKTKKCYKKEGKGFEINGRELKNKKE